MHVAAIVAMNPSGDAIGIAARTIECGMPINAPSTMGEVDDSAGVRKLALPEEMKNRTIAVDSSAIKTEATGFRGDNPSITQSAGGRRRYPRQTVKMAQLFPIQEPKRTAIALVLCVASVVIGTGLLLRRATSPTVVAFDLWIVWNDTAYWLEHRHWLLHREGRDMLRKTPQEIYRTARAGGLVVHSTVARTIKRCAECMALTAIACLFIV